MWQKVSKEVIEKPRSQKRKRSRSLPPRPAERYLPCSRPSARPPRNRTADTICIRGIVGRLLDSQLPLPPPSRTGVSFNAPLEGGYEVEIRERPSSSAPLMRSSSICTRCGLVAARLPPEQSLDQPAIKSRGSFGADAGAYWLRPSAHGRDGRRWGRSADLGGDLREIEQGGRLRVR